MSVYQQYPALSESAVGDRTKYFRQVVLQHLQAGNELAPLAGVLADAVGREEYEMAEGIAQAAEAFRSNPQLGLFGLTPAP